MGELFFHIGLHKTGTTWLQTCLFPNLTNLKFHCPRKIEEIRNSAIGDGRQLISHEGMSGKLSFKKSPGFCRQRLLQNLELITEMDSKARILIGFREHRAWINAAFAQQAKKKNAVDPAHYLLTFSREDLCWQEVLALVERSAGAVFPYLYEELITAPHALVEDMCGFLGCDPPANVDFLIKTRANVSPRTEFGQRISRQFYRLQRLTGRVRLYEKLTMLRGVGATLGASLDRFGSPIMIEFNPTMASDLREDWSALVKKVSAIRSRQLCE
jgi:hypothetical protein